MRIPAIALISLAFACASPREVAEPAPGLVPESQLPSGLLIRHRLHYRYAESEGAVEAVVQVSCGEVVVLGLGPAQTRLFSIRQKGTQVTAESIRPWPAPPERILLDVHRMFFYPIADPPRPDGRHETVVASLRTEELWSDGRLVERRIPSASDPGAAVRVRYGGGATPREPPASISLFDEALGYELEMTMHEHRVLECDPSDPD